MGKEGEAKEREKGGGERPGGRGHSSSPSHAFLFLSPSSLFCLVFPFTLSDEPPPLNFAVPAPSPPASLPFPLTPSPVAPPPFCSSLSSLPVVQAAYEPSYGVPHGASFFSSVSSLPLLPPICSRSTFSFLPPPQREYGKGEQQSNRQASGSKLGDGEKSKGRKRYDAKERNEKREKGKEKPNK